MSEKVKPRKAIKKPIEPVEIVQSTTPEYPKEEPVKAEPKVAEKPKLPSGMVKVKVLTGTLSFEGGSYEKGEVFTVSKKRLEGFDPRFFEIIK